MIKAVIFDCDGLLVDTETAWYEAYYEVFQAYGVNLPLHLYAKSIGNSKFEDFNPLKYFQECIDTKIDIKSIHTKIRKKHKMLMKDVELRPGVKDYLLRAKSLGLRIGLASSSESVWVEEYLQKYNIREYFDTVKTSDMVINVKPEPDLYLEAIRSLGIKGNEAIAFEDSLIGLEAAKKAGLYCVVVPNKATRGFTFEGYNIIMKSMEDMTLDEVIAKVLSFTESYSL